MSISAVSNHSLSNYKVKLPQVDTQNQQMAKNQSQNQIDPDHDGDIDTHLGRDIDLRA